MQVSTGCPGLDEILGGGLPPGRTTLLTGGPGTGKSTLAMQFLQAGLDRGESCLFVSTEQTHDELRDSFEPFSFDLDHERLDVVTIEAVPGRAVQHDDSMLTFEMDETDERVIDGGEAVSSHYVRDELRPYAPQDRVVLDSISGLAGMATNAHSFRRDVLEIIRFVADEFGATAVFTSERGTPLGPQTGVEGVDPLKYATHGVIDLRRERVRGDVHRRLTVEKLRGRNHDPRDYEFELTTDGVRVLARRPARPERQPEMVSTGLPGFDDLLGGGIVQGGTGLVTHDGRANLNEIVARVMEAAIDQGFVVPFGPSVNMTPDQLDSYFSEGFPSAAELREDDKLFIYDAAGVRDQDKHNVFTVDEGRDSIQSGALKIDERRGDRPLYYILNTEALLHSVTPDELRNLRYWARRSYLTPEDTALFLHYPDMIDDKLAEFFVDDANQVVHTWLDEAGLQYLSLQKSPTGHVGGTRYVEYSTDEPYVRVQSPARTGLDG